MTVLDIVREYLKENGYDGLCDGDGCGCCAEDLMPCNYMGCMTCVPGYKVEKKDACRMGFDTDYDRDWVIVERKVKHSKEPCPECGGTGTMPEQWTMMLDGICDTCGGSGEVDKEDE